MDNITEEKLAALEQMVVDQATQIKSLQEQLAEFKTAQPQQPKNEEKKKLKTPEQPFTVDKVKYRFLVPSFRVPVVGGLKKVLSEDALKDKELLASLVKNKVTGIIEPVKE